MNNWHPFATPLMTVSPWYGAAEGLVDRHGIPILTRTGLPIMTRASA